MRVHGAQTRAISNTFKACASSGHTGPTYASLGWTTTISTFVSIARWVLRRCTRVYELGHILLACFKPSVIQPPAKQLIPQPNAIAVDHIALTITRNFLNPPIPKVPFHIGAGQTIGISCSPMILLNSLVP